MTACAKFSAIGKGGCGFALQMGCSIRMEMGLAGLPLPMACPIPQSKLCSRTASISSGLLPGVASGFTMHIVLVFLISMR